MKAAAPAAKATRKAPASEEKPMNRVIHLDMPEAAVTQACADAEVGISVIERLLPSGIRLVCSSAGGAAAIRYKLRASIIHGPVTRSPIFKGGMQAVPHKLPVSSEGPRRASPADPLDAGPSARRARR